MAHRKLIVSQQTFRLLGPKGLTELLLTNGFRLGSMGCPVIINEPKHVEHVEGDAVVIYHQWDTELEKRKWTTEHSKTSSSA